MSRNASGTYTLPQDSVVGGTVIEANWANPTMDDIATAITDSLSRSGKGTMISSLKYFSGTVAVPGISFTDEPGSGVYYFGTKDFRFSVNGNPTLRFVDDSGSASGSQRPVMVYNGTAFQPILKGDSSETPIFKGFTTTGELTIDAGGLDIEAGGLTVSAGGIDITGTVAVTGSLTATTINSGVTIARGAISGVGTPSIDYGLGITSVADYGVGTYRVQFDDTVVRNGTELFCLCAPLDNNGVNIITYGASTSAVYVLIEDNAGTRVDSDFTIFTLLEP